MDLMMSQWVQIHENFHTPTISQDFRTLRVFLACKIVDDWEFKFTNFFCRFLNPNTFFQFEF